MPPRTATAETARLILAGSVIIALIAAAVTLSALGRPLTDLLALVGMVVMPILIGLGVITVKNTNGNNTELLNLVKARLDSDALEKQHMMRQLREQGAMLAASTPMAPALSLDEYQGAAA